MKEYYKADNELVKQVIDYFGHELLMNTVVNHHKDFEIGGKTWICTQSGYENNTDGSLPEDRRINGEVILTQKDGTKHPAIHLSITVDHGIG